MSITQDYAGGEIYDLFAVPASGGQPINLTKTLAISETNPHWSPDGKTLAISIKLKTSPSFDVALLDWHTHEVRNPTREQSRNRMWEIVAWSPDGRSLYANRANAAHTDSDIYRIDVERGAATKPDTSHGRRSISGVLCFRRRANIGDPFK